MFPMHPAIALDLAHERMRESRAEARQHWLATLAPVGSPAQPQPAGTPGRLRRALVAALRAVEGAASSLARTACQAARRLEGRAA
jgi:hypothetical protein